MSTLISRIYNWVSDKASNVKITASRMDSEMDQVIAALNRKVLCSASAPSSPIAGQTWFDTTNKYLKVYRNNEWCIITVLHVGTSAPSTIQEGDVWYDTTNDVLKAYNGTSWLTIGPSMTSILGAYKNLKIVRASVTQVTVTADELILKDSSNIPVLVSSVSETIAITTSGAGGLDTGSESSGVLTVYYIWIIRKSSDGTVDGLLSTSSTSPTMPSGYDQKALFGHVLNNTSNDFIDFVRYGSKYYYTTPQTIASGNLGATWASVDTTKYVPSVFSDFCHGTFVDGGSTGGVSNDSASTTAAGGPSQIEGSAGAASRGFYWAFPILTANTLYARSDNAGFAMYLDGFDINRQV